MNEIKETAIWLINILGMLAIVVGGILMKSATWLIIGGIMCTIYYSATGRTSAEAPWSTSSWP